MTASALRDPGGALQSSSIQGSASTPLETTGNELQMPRGTGAATTLESSKHQPDTISDKATSAFVRRTLCSQHVLLGNGERGRTTPQPIEEVLPPLTSSNEVDLQLYGIIAVIIKEFVQTWYSKITPDHVFVNEVLQIIAHCTRALEQRLRMVDLEAVLLDEIPELLEAHLSTFRLAKQTVSSPSSLVLDPRWAYHALSPHPALTPVPTESVPQTSAEQRESESAWRQMLVQGVLTVLLPIEDLENGCLRALVAEIFAEMILGNGISGKACEGWLLWEGITSIAKVLSTDDTKEEGPVSASISPEQSMTRLERYGLLSTARNEVIETTSSPAASRDSFRTRGQAVTGFFWTAIHYAFLAFAAIRALMLTLVASSSLPSRSARSEQTPIETQSQSRLPASAKSDVRRPPGSKRPIVSMRLWSCLAQFVELSIRMPWLSGSVSMLHWGLVAGPGKVGDTDGILDRVLSDAIHKRILNPTFLPAILRTLRATLFPNNTLAPPRQPPSDDEILQIKERCATSLLNLIPSKLAATYLATSDTAVQLSQIEDILSCLDDSYLNKHLIFQIIELLIVRLVPELGEQGLCELMAERSVDGPTDLPNQSSSSVS